MAQQDRRGKEGQKIKHSGEQPPEKSPCTQRLAAEQAACEAGDDIEGVDGWSDLGFLQLEPVQDEGRVEKNRGGKG